MESTIGTRIIANVLRTGDLKPFLQAGMTSRWLSSNQEGAWGVFLGEEHAQYDTLLKQWSVLHHQVDLSTFEKDHGKFRAPDDRLKAADLIHLARLAAQQQVMFNVIGDLADAYDNQRYDECLDILSTDATIPLKVLSQAGSSLARMQDFNLADEMLHPDHQDVIATGWPNVDSFRLRPGHLVTLIGRQKAGKSLTAISMALGTWRDGWSSIFYSVELAPQIVRNRLYAMGAGANLTRMDNGELNGSEKERVRAFHKEVTRETDARLFISSKTAMITMDDIAAEVEQTRPHIIFIDGFYFMKDRITGKTATDWEANENLAAELKQFAMREGIVVVTTTQAQEKQQGKKQKLGIEARTIMGGTGLLKASDLVLGQDKDGDLRLLHEVASRFTPVDKYHFQWDFTTMQRQGRDDHDTKLAVVQKKLGL